MPPKNRPKRKRSTKPRHPGRHKGLVLLHQLIATANRAADLAEEFLHEHGEACRCPTCRYVVQSGAFASYDGQADLWCLRRDLMALSHVATTYTDFLDGRIPRLPPEEPTDVR